MRNVDASLLLTEARLLLSRARIPLVDVLEAWDQTQSAGDYQTPTIFSPMNQLESAINALDTYIHSVEQNRVKFRHPE